MDFIKVSEKETIAQTVSLAKEVWEEHYIPIIGKGQVDYMLGKYQSEEAIAEQIARQGFIYHLIVKNREPIGYMAVVPNNTKKEVFLSKLYLISSERGHGYARKSLNFIENIAEELGADKIRLSVNKDNSGAIIAYINMGFNTVDSAVTDIGSGFVMDDYIMEKRIAPVQNLKN